MNDFSALGKNLKDIRTQMGLALGAVSELTGVSKTMLSQIERGKSVPTLSVIWKIANGLKIRIDALIKDNSTRYIVNNISNIVPLKTDKADVLIYNILPFSPANGFEVFYGVFMAGCHYISNGHLNLDFEYCFLTYGAIQIIVDGVVHHLKQGDYFSFNAKKEHHYINNTDADAGIHIILNYN